MNLEAALIAIANQLQLNATELTVYANEDKIPGYYDGGNEYGTAYANDGKVLYALVLALKPAKILEIGTHHGGSACHLAMACKKNKAGHVWTLDNNPDAGQHIPKSLQPYVTLVQADADVELHLPDAPFDFVFEDGSHSEHQVHTLVSQWPRLTTPETVIVHHDATVEGVGQQVWNGIEKGRGTLRGVHFYQVDPSPYGLAIYHRGE